MAGKEATPQVVNLIRQRLLLNKPIYLQYWHFLYELLHGNLGYSYIHGQPVTTVIAQAFPITLSLVLGASALWLVIGILSGILSAVRRGSVWDRSVTATALVFYSMPFVLGLLLQFVFYYEFTIHGIHTFPAPGYTSFTTSPSLWFRGLILLMDSLGARVRRRLYPAGRRGSMSMLMGEDYIRTARAKADRTAGDLSPLPPLGP